MVFLMLTSGDANAQQLIDPNFRSIHQRESEFYRFYPTSPDTSVKTEQIPRLQKRTAPSLSHEVFGYLPYWKYSSYYTLDFDLLTTIAYFSTELGTDGSIINDYDWPASGLISVAHQHGVRVVLCATLFGSNDLTTFLSSSSARTNCIINLLNRVKSANADGINIDFEAMPSSQRSNLVSFMEELADSFRMNIDDAHISMATPAVDWSNAWNYRELAEICDALFIMGYDYHWSGSDVSGPVSPLSDGTYNIQYTIDDYLSKTNNNREKIILGLPYYGYEWQTVSSNPGANTTATGEAKTYTTAEQNAANYGKLRYADSRIPWYCYQTSSWYQCWYDDSLSLALKYNYAKSVNLCGIGIWALTYDGSRSELWDAIGSAFSGEIIPPEPPETPEGLIVRNISNGNIQVYVDPVIYAQEYAYYISEDCIYFSLHTQINSTDLFIGNLNPGQIYYFKVQALNSYGVSDFSEIGAVIPTLKEPKILIVNGYDYQESYGTPRNVYHHSNAINPYRHAVDFASNEAIIRNTVELEDYEMVDWILGDESAENITLGSDEQTAIAEYLENGGNLFISGMEIGDDLADSAASQESRDFYHNYLKSDFINERVGQVRVFPADSSIFNSILGVRLMPRKLPVLEELYPDGIKPRNGAQIALNYTSSNYESDGCAAISYEGKFGSSEKSGKLVYFAFPFETVFPDSNRILMMGDILSFFGMIYPDSSAWISKGNFQILSNFPNPGKPYTTFPILLDSTNTSKEIDIIIYNMLGREIYREQLSISGSDPVLYFWNGRFPHSHVVPSGIYFIKADHGIQSAIRKFTIIH